MKTHIIVILALFSINTPSTRSSSTTDIGSSNTEFNNSVNKRHHHHHRSRTLGGHKSAMAANESLDKIVPVFKSPLSDFNLPNNKNSRDAEDNIGFWSVAEPDLKSNNCILLRSAINITLFLDEDKSEIINLSVPKEAKANGTCFTLWDDFQDITLSWKDTLHFNKTTNSLTLTFASNWTSELTDGLGISQDEYALNSIEVFIRNSETTDNDNLLLNIAVTDLTEFSIPKNHSYECKLNQILDYKKLQLQVANLQFEAFRDPSNNLKDTFSPSVDCSIDVDSRKWHLKTIMIIVWSSVACLLIALTIAFFLIKRRRASSGGNGEYRILE